MAQGQMGDSQTYQIQGKDFIVTTCFTDKSEKTFGQKLIELVLKDLADK